MRYKLEAIMVSETTDSNGDTVENYGENKASNVMLKSSLKHSPEDSEAKEAARTKLSQEFGQFVRLLMVGASNLHPTENHDSLANSSSKGVQGQSCKQKQNQIT